MPLRKALDLYRRLQGRSLHELIFRGRQEVYKRGDLIAYRLGMEMRPRPREAAGSKPRFFFLPADLPAILDRLRAARPADADEIVARAERLCAHEFDLLGFRGLDFGAEIDWHLDAVHGRRSPLVPWYRVPFLDFEAIGDHKVVWELNRHQHFVTLAKAFLLTRERRFLDELVTQWRHWVAHNPYPLGINWASALEVAFRSLSWIWVDHLLRDQPEVPPGFLDELRCALGQHGRYLSRYLSTYFAPNTHLIGEAVALFFLGTLYPNLPGARRWRTTGWRITQEEAVKQVRSDGLHFEQSIYYHVYALDFFLHACLLARRNEVAVPRAFEEVIERMAEALVVLSPGGLAPRAGDDDGGRVFDPCRNRPVHMLDPVVTAAAAFDRPEWSAVAGPPIEETLWLLGPEAFSRAEETEAVAPTARSAALPDSGLYVMAGRLEGGWRMVIDVGPFGTGRCGHGHADALSVQLAASRDWLIDVGTGTYMDRDQRNLFRGTPAHNTLTVAGADQAVATEPFAWKGIPNVTLERWSTTPAFDYLRASHDGYKTVAPGFVHRRTVVAADGFWLVRDEAVGGTNVGGADLVVAWHLAPHLSCASPDTLRVKAAHGAENLTLAFAGPTRWTLTLDGDQWSPAYGAVQATRVVRVEAQAQLPTEVASLIVPEDWDGDFEHRRLDNAVVYSFSAGPEVVCVVFGSGPWRIGGLARDHELALLRGPSFRDLLLVGALSAATPAVSRLGRGRPHGESA